MINQSMEEHSPQIFVVEKGTFADENRMDVSYFHPRYLENIARISASKNVSNLEVVSSRIKKGIFYILASEYTRWGVPFIRVSNLKDGTVNPENLVYITEEKNTKEIKTEFHAFDILISKTGNLTISVVPESIEKCNISQDIIGIEIKKIHNPMYIWAFLSSKYGLTQLERMLQGQVQPHITVKDVRTLKIPIATRALQEAIVRILKDTTFRKEQITDKIKFLRRELGRSFLEALNLNYPNSLAETSYVTEIEDRLDAWYYHPQFTRIIIALKNGKYALKRLGDFINFSEEEISPSKEPFRNFKYVQIQNVDPETHEIRDYTLVSGKEAPGRAKMAIKANDILVPVLGGSIDSVAFVPPLLDGEVATNGFAVLRIPDKATRTYVYYYMTSRFVQMQISRLLTGTIMPSISKTELKEILIPVPPKATLKRIADIIITRETEIKNLREELLKIEEESNSEYETQMERIIDGGNNFK